jgi:hypothetical protein
MPQIITITNQGAVNTDPQQRTHDTSASHPNIVARLDMTKQAANLAATNICTVSPQFPGMYRVWAYAVTTQAATTSSTLPLVLIGWTDADTGVASNLGVTTTNTANTLGTATNGPVSILPKPGTAIQVSTSGYLSAGATPLQYSLHVRVEYVA